MTLQAVSLLKYLRSPEPHKLTPVDAAASMEDASRSTPFALWLPIEPDSDAEPA